jgi:hypothetical protein
VIVLAALLFWVAADRLAPASDYDRRVAEVARLLPASAHRSQSSSYENGRNDVYDVPGRPASVEAHIRRAGRKVFGPHEMYRRWRDDAPNSIDFAFTGRGCDGEVELSVDIVAKASSSRVTISAHCYD